MGLNTDFNQSPYFDDFDETKNFHRVLFKPGVAVQARELTQLQTILQNQIERFGNNILREGTIIQGCNFVEVTNMYYAKILDLQVDGAPVSMSTYLDQKAVGVTTGVTAIIQAVATGLESQTPNLNTIFVKYLTVGVSNAKVFSPNENIEIRNKSTNELIATVTIAGTVDTSSTGEAYAVKVGDGIIYQKGHFVKVDPQLAIVSKYSNSPDSVIVGFQTVESVVNSNNDTSLLDNANGFNNYNAPGADRLKLTATLVTKTLDEAAADETFFGIQEYNLGKVVRRNKTTQYDGILKTIEERTKDESGNYTVDDFPLSIRPHIAANTGLLSVMIGKGKAYVEGKQVELTANFDLDLPKATTFDTEQAQTITQNIGNYVLVDTYTGDFNPQISAQATIYSANSGGGSAIGTARIRAITLDNGTAGTTAAVYRFYIFDVTMNSGQSFSSAKSFKYTGGAVNGVANLLSTRIYDTAFKRSIFPLGRDAIKAVPASGTTMDFVFRTKKTGLTINGAAGSLSITLSEGEWPYGIGPLNADQKRDIMIIPTSTSSPYTAGVVVDLSSATVTVSATDTISITGLATAASNINAVAYYNIKQTASQPAKKDLETVYVTINCASHSATTSGPYSLGLPDVYSIEGVYVGATYSESNPNKVSQFNLVTGQKDTHYGLSSITKKRSLTLTSADRLLVKMKVFKKNVTGSYTDGIFTVNSYPIDDANTANTAAIQTENIPLYKMENGTIIDLRNVIDMRPYAANTAAYSTTIGGATNNPGATVSFGTSDLYAIAPNKDFESDYDYYLARRDLLVIDGKGYFKVIQGTPLENPSTPSEPNTGMVLGVIKVAPYPSLDPKSADLANKPQYGVTLSKRDNRRYTMKDIAGIDRRVQNLEYYTALNTLEVRTKDLIIPGADGLDRFKNGIFADSFKNLAAANIRDINFSAAIDPSNEEITAKFKMLPIDLVYSSVEASNVTNYPKMGVTTLEKVSDKNFIRQPYATSFRNCVTDFYKYNGIVSINPPYDSSYDTTAAPAIDFTVDLTEPFADLVENISNFVPLSTSSTSSQRVNQIISSTVTGNRGSVVTTTTTSRIGTIDTTVTASLTSTSNTTTSSVGEFVTNVSMSPFIRSRTIMIYAVGLRPSTRHYLFFDGKDVNAFAGRASAILGNDDSLENLAMASRPGSLISTDSNGVLRAYFTIPAETFYNGDRELLICDVDDINSINAGTSFGRVTYSAFNFGQEKAQVSFTTRAPDFNTVTSTTVTDNTRIVTTTSTVDEGRERGDNDDPISQTFKIKNTHSSDSIVMLTKMDLYFKEKSSTKGITVQVRETQNGYPAPTIVPFGSVYLTPTQVSVSNTANTATTIVFPAPVSLKVGSEYCFVAIPDGNDPDYLIWTSKTGLTDVTNNIAVTQDSHDGTLFTSTNNRAWTPYQDENIKFNLYKGQFASSGSMTLTNWDNEFLVLDSVSGSFRLGEKFGVLSANSVGTISVSNTSYSVTGTGTNFSHIQTGDHIAYYANSTVLDIVQVASVANTTSLTLKEYPRFANTSTRYFKTVIGNYIYTDKEGKYVLENSSARSGSYTYTNQSSGTETGYNYFVANTTVFGEITQATATISEVTDQNVSYLQPNLYKSNTLKTNATLNAHTLTSNSTGTNYLTDLQYMPTNDNTYLNKTPTIIKSRSNEIVDGTGKSFRFKLNLESESVDSSPIIDYRISNMSVYEYMINDDITNETSGDGEGSALSKYISKTVTLAEGFDADDMTLYITGYRPAGTDIKVYVRFQNVSDPRDHDAIEWSELALKSENNFYSSSTNIYDYKEFQYYIPSQASGDFSAGSGAALNSNNSNILRYIDENGVIYDSYKTFSIKIVMTSTSHKATPKLKDIRAIALT